MEVYNTMKKEYSLLFFLLLFVATPGQIYSQSQYYIEGADQTELYVQEFGEGDPVILLSGGPFLNAIYLKDIWEHSNSQFKWIVLDQRGTGNSIVENPDSSSFSLNNYVGDLEALRKKIDADQLTLVGHSWGGMLAMEYAAHHPNMVKKLVLLGSGGPTVNFNRYFFDNINLRLHDEDRSQMAKLKKQNKNTLPAYFPGYFYDRDRAMQIKKETDFENWYGQMQFFPIVFQYYGATQKERVERLNDYTDPVHLIQGRQDPIGISTAFKIKETMPQTKIYFIERAGHFPWLENKKQRTEFFSLLYKALSKAKN